MSDLFKTQLQDTAKASVLGLTLKEVAADVLELGIDPEDCVFSGSSLVVARTMPDDPSPPRCSVGCTGPYHRDDCTLAGQLRY